MIDEEDEFKFGFDILDATKIWPEEIIPVRIIGKMTLNRNVDNFFAETEQVAFCAGNVVPGIDFSNDPLLQGRLFSYLDTQLIRLGGPNFHEIPINRPVAPIHNNQRDGYHRMTIDQGAVSYHPNSIQKNTPEPASDVDNGYLHYAEKVDGKKVRERSESFKDNYSQATLFWNSMSEPEKQHIIDAFHFEVGSVKDKYIKQRVVDMFNNVDGQLAIEIAKGIGAMPPKTAGGTGVTASSPAVSQANTIKIAKTRKVAVLVDKGFNYPELMQFMDAMKNEGVHTEIVSKSLGMITSEDGKQIEVGRNYLNAASIMYDAVYVTGGKQNIDSLLKQGDALHFINEAFKHVKAIGATNEGVDLLAASQMQGVAIAGNENKGELITELGVVTIRNSADINGFNKEFIKAIAEHRHWARKNQKDMVPA